MNNLHIVPYLKQIQISKLKTTINIMLLLLFSGLLSAQKTDSIPVSKIPLYSGGISGGVVGNIPPVTGQACNSYLLQNFQEIVPTNSRLRDDFSKHDTSRSEYNANAIFNLFASVPLTLKNNNWFDLELRGNLLFCSKQKEALTFSGIDTAQTKGIYFFEFKGKNIGFEVCPLFYFKKLRVLHPYIGIGLGMAYSYNNEVISQYNPNGKTAKPIEWGFMGVTEGTEEQTIRLKNTASYYFNIPFGLSLKRRTKPTRITPFIDFKYGIKLEKYPRTQYRAVQAIYSQVGVKINFYKSTL